MKQIVHAACSHDCPDACGVLITVENGRATKIQGDPAHPVTRGFLCAKVAKYLDRVYSPDRVLYPMRRIAPKGVAVRQRSFAPLGQPRARPGPAEGASVPTQDLEKTWQRISWDEALDEISSRFRNIVAEFGSEAILPFSYGGTLGALNGASMDRQIFWPAGRLATRACNLLGGGRSRLDFRSRRETWHRAGAVRSLPLHHRVGLEHSRQQRSPLAVHRGSATQRREAGGDRSLPHADGCLCRLVSSDQSGNRWCAGARDDARDHRRRPARRRLCLEIYPRFRTTPGKSESLSAGARFAMDGNFRRRYSQAGIRVCNRASLGNPPELRRAAL